MKKRKSILGISYDCFKALLDEGDRERVKKLYEDLYPTMEYIIDNLNDLPEPIQNSFFIALEGFLVEMKGVEKQIFKQRVYEAIWEKDNENDA